METKQDLKYKFNYKFYAKIPNMPGHVIPYNLISLKSNPPRLHSIAMSSRLWSKYVYDARGIQNGYSSIALSPDVWGGLMLSSGYEK